MEDRESTIPFDQIHIDRILSSLSWQDQVRILGNLLWDFFGDVDEDGKAIIIPGRACDKVDVLSAATSLRQELWPELFPDGSVAGDRESLH